MKTIITRAEYLANSSQLHDKYYSQFVTPYIKDLIISRVGLKTLLASRDKNLNDIPLASWDGVASQNICKLSSVHELSRQTKEGGVTLAMGVCIAKAAARIIIKENKK